MNTTTVTMTALTRIGDALYGRPFCDDQGRPMVAVYYGDGERFVTYAVPAALLS